MGRCLSGFFSPPFPDLPMKHRRNGFSLLELLVAMTILAVLGTIGFTQFQKKTAQARHLKAIDTLRTVAAGLDQYYLKPNRGHFPELATFQAMVEPNSPLVKESLIPANLSPNDPWGNPYEGSSSRGTYMLKCGGDPDNAEEFPPIVKEAGKAIDTGQAPAASGTPAPAEGPAK